MPGTELVRADGQTCVIRDDTGKMGRLISCKDASRLISQLQDGNIPLRQWVRIRLHLLWCEACRRFAEQLRFLHQAMQRYGE